MTNFGLDYGFPMGYGVTKGPVNLYNHFAMKPYTFETHYGMETQYNMFPSYASELQCALAQGITNPNHISQWNPMLFGFDIGNNDSNMFNTEKMMQSAAEAGIRFAENYTAKEASGMIDSSTKSLATFKGNLENALKEEKFTDAQKAQIQAEIVKVEALEAKLAEIKENKEGLESKAVLEKLEALKGEELALREGSKKLAENISKELQEAKTNPDKVEETKKTEEVVNEDGTITVEKADGTTVTVKTQAEADKILKEEQTKADAAAKTKTEANDKLTQKSLDTAAELYVAINGVSGSNDKLIAAVDKITKDNVLDVLAEWEMQYRPLLQSEDPNGLIESIYDEFNYTTTDTDDKTVTKVVEALRERAKSMGTEVYASVSSQFAIIDNELGSSWVVESKIAIAVNTIFERLFKAEISK